MASKAVKAPDSVDMHHDLEARWDAAVAAYLEASGHEATAESAQTRARRSHAAIGNVLLLSDRDGIGAGMSDKDAATASNANLRERVGAERWRKGSAALCSRARMMARGVGMLSDVALVNITPDDDGDAVLTQAAALGTLASKHGADVVARTINEVTPKIDGEPEPLTGEGALTIVKAVRERLNPSPAMALALKVADITSKVEDPAWWIDGGNGNDGDKQALADAIQALGVVLESRTVYTIRGMDWQGGE